MPIEKPEVDPKDTPPVKEPDTVGAGVTMDTLYPPKVDEKPDADKGGEPAKTGEKKPEARPDKKPDEAAAPPAWDKKRQERDQEHANERRAFMGQLDAMQKTNEALVERLEAMGTPAKPAEPDESVQELSERIDGLGDDADPADLVAAVKALRRALSRPHTSADVKELRDQLANLNESIQAMRTEGQQREESQAAYEGRKSRLAAKLVELDGKHGVAVRNEAVKKAVAVLAEQGYTADHGADEFAEHLLLERCYAEAAEDAKTKPKTKPRVGDNGVGGPGPAAPRKTGTLDEVLDRMEHQGKVA